MSGFVEPYRVLVAPRLVVWIGIIDERWIEKLHGGSGLLELSSLMGMLLENY